MREGNLIDLVGESMKIAYGWDWVWMRFFFENVADTTITSDMTLFPKIPKIFLKLI